MIDLSYPDYSRSERVVDGVIQIAGLVTAIIGVTVLFAMWAFRMDGVTLASTIIYSSALLLMLAASAAYHLYAHTVARPVLRRLDHAAIYVKIAGTFTPLSMLLGTAFGYVVLALVWLLALFGAATKIMATRGTLTTGWLPYVLLGWTGLALFVPLSGILPAMSLSFLLAGGLIYTGGLIFYLWESLKFSNALWHLCVVLASGCFFAGIVLALAPSL